MDKNQSVESQTFKKVALLPFSVEKDSLRKMVQGSILTAVLMYTERTIVGRDEIDEPYLRGLGFSHPETIGSLDLTNKPDGLKRLAKLRKKFGAEAIIVGTFVVNDHGANLSAQLIDTRKAVVVSSYSKEMEIKNDNVHLTVKSLAKDCVQSMFGILKN